MTEYIFSAEGNATASKDTCDLNEEGAGKMEISLYHLDHKTLLVSLLKCRISQCIFGVSRYELICLNQWFPVPTCYLQSQQTFLKWPRNDNDWPEKSMEMGIEFASPKWLVWHSQIYLGAVTKDGLCKYCCSDYTVFSRSYMQRL